MVYNRLYYCVFFIISHLVYSLLFSCDFALSLQKRKPLYTAKEILLQDLKILKDLFVVRLLKGCFLLVVMWFISQSIFYVAESMATIDEIGIFVFACFYSYLVVFIVFIAYGFSKREVAKVEKQKVNLKVFNIYKYKKLSLFYKTHQKTNNLFVYVLSTLTYLNVFNFFQTAFLGFSFVFDFGRSYALFSIFTFFLTYVLYYKSVEDWLCVNYGPNSIRLLGWNMFQTAVMSSGRKVALVAATGIAGGVVLVGNDSVGSYLYQRNLNQYYQNDVLFNQIIDKKRLADPEGHSKGRYPYRNSVSNLKHETGLQAALRAATGIGSVSNELGKTWNNWSNPQGDSSYSKEEDTKTKKESSSKDKEEIPRL